MVRRLTYFGSLKHGYSVRSDDIFLRWRDSSHVLRPLLVCFKMSKILYSDIELLVEPSRNSFNNALYNLLGVYLWSTFRLTDLSLKLMASLAFLTWEEGGGIKPSFFRLIFHFIWRIFWLKHLQKKDWKEKYPER